MRRSLAQVVVIALFAMGLVAGATAQKIDKIVFFGDSLTDSGNNFLLTGQSTRIPFPLGPAAFSYNIGGHQYSNGQVWSQDLANGLALPLSGLPRLQSHNGELFSNYAVGEARSRSNAPAFSDFSLTQQVSIFIDDYNGTVPPNTLVAIWIGANDLEDALDALKTDPSGGTSEVILQQATAAVLENLQTLYQHGARMFLIANIPDLSETPYVRFLGLTDPTIPTIASQITNEFNTSVESVASGFSVSPGLQFFRLFDANALLNLVISSPGKFHLLDAIDRCTVPLVNSNAICNMPDSYLFWDATHPTTAGHRLIARAVFDLLPPQSGKGNGNGKGKGKGKGHHL
ncbi:MAG: SGNH/GDSL hydrolase family protein [Candidatus Sulfotelmatobacter sp.]